MDLDELRRAAQSDPKDVDLQIRLWHARARVEGPDAYLIPLKGRAVWNQSPQELQDLVIEEVGKRLGEDYEHVETRSWLMLSYTVLPSKGLPPNDTYLKENRLEHRLATFRHKLTRMELNLLPGNQSLEPFLMGRWPVTVRQSSIFQEESLARNEGEEVGDPMVGLSCASVEDRLKSRGMSLPTGEQWEYACQGGSSAYYFWGERFDGAYVWHAENSGATRESVLEHERSGHWNAFGLVDILGNVWEWTADAAVSFHRVSEQCRGWSFRSTLWDIEQNPGGVETMAYPFSWREMAEGESADDIGFRAVKVIPGR